MTLRGFHGVAKELPCSLSFLKNKSNSSKLHTALPSSAYDVCNTCVFWTNLSKGGVGTSCIAIAMSTFWFVLSRDCSVLPATSIRTGGE